MSRFLSLNASYKDASIAASISAPVNVSVSSAKVSSLKSYGFLDLFYK